MKKSYRDCLNRIACYADGATGLVEHEYKKVKTKTIVPVGGEYFIERDKTITVTGVSAYLIASTASSRAFAASFLSV